MSTTQPDKPPRVGLFVTCLVDLFRPNVGFAAVKLLEQAGCVVEVPQQQVCCGQPAFNSGDNRNTRTIAKQVIEAFEGFDHVVAPSGSCAAMIKEHYPSLFPASTPWRERARDLSRRTHELLSYLTDVRGVDGVSERYDGSVTYHDSCSGLREMGVATQPRALLASVQGLILDEMRDSDVCCGFGGTFCVKFPGISQRMASDKLRSVTDTGASTLLGGDLGCLLNMTGCFRRAGSDVKVYHAAEVLAGMAEIPGLGDGEDRT